MLASIHLSSSLHLSQGYFRLAKSGSTEERWCHQQKVAGTELNTQLWSSRGNYGAFSVNKLKNVALWTVPDSIRPEQISLVLGVVWLQLGFQHFEFRGSKQDH